MDSYKFFKYILIIGFIAISSIGFAQEDSVNIQSEKISKSYKNTIRWNPTPNLVFNTKTLIFGYERVLNKKQTISLNFGYMEFPDLSPDFIDQILTYTYTMNHGYNMALDYRFYLTKRNKFPIPDGFYLGPFILNYNYKFGSDVSIIENDIVTGEFGLDTKIKLLSIGFELGYQIVIRDRFTLDMLLFGPSSSFYNLNAKIDGELTGDEEYEQLKRLKEVLLDSIPWLKPFIENGEIDSNGKISHSGLGFRYAFMIGYRF